MGKPKGKFDLKNESDPVKVSQLGNKKRFHPQDLISLSPKNPRQEQFLIDFYSQVPMIIQKGAAGAGKSTLALYAAFSEVFEQSSPYDKVVIIRSAVSTRDIGFLPGTLEEKSEPYEEPFRCIANDLIKYNDPYDNLKSLGYLEFRLSSNLRSMTFDDSIIIIEEYQNFEQGELLSALSRAGRHCKIIICGDTKQDDISGKKGQKSCTDYLDRLVNLMDDSFVSTVTYTFDDCLRNPLVKEILRADSLL